MDPAATVSMEDVDEELVRRSCDFMQRSVEADRPFFLWHNSTRCHVWTHLSEKWKDKSGFGLYADAMMELDWEVGQLLDKLDELGIADNTIVLFTSDNGAETFTWPDGGNHPFRGEKGTTYEGDFRVPMVARWPGVIEPGTIVNDIFASEDWVPTLVAAAGDPDVKEKLLTGHQAGDDKIFKNHLDGYNFMPYFTGEADEGPRHEFFYFTDNADLSAVRYNAWKVSFKTIDGNLFTGKPDATNVPVVTNLRADPWERYQTESMMYGRWWGGEAVHPHSGRGHRRTVPPDVRRVPTESGVRHLRGRTGVAGAPGRWAEELTDQPVVRIIVPRAGGRGSRELARRWRPR